MKVTDYIKDINTKVPTPYENTASDIYDLCCFKAAALQEPTSPLIISQHKRYPEDIWVTLTKNHIHGNLSLDDEGWVIIPLNKAVFQDIDKEMAISLFKEHLILDDKSEDTNTLNPSEDVPLTPDKPMDKTPDNNLELAKSLVTKSTYRFWCVPGWYLTKTNEFLQISRISKVAPYGNFDEGWQIKIHIDNEIFTDKWKPVDQPEALAALEYLLGVRK